MPERKSEQVAGLLASFTPAFYRIPVYNKTEVAMEFSGLLHGEPITYIIPPRTRMEMDFDTLNFHGEPAAEQSL